MISDAARNVIGNVISFASSSPLPTLWRIIKNKDGGVQVGPAFSDAAQLHARVFYGILCAIFARQCTPPATIMIPNGLDALFGLGLTLCYYKSTPRRIRTLLKCD
ncbi:hypothetical protein ZWY2020_010309 [Hordeum vulgare]|nr:hypothetical protein ZWY2020_010309 [Hordeum vulgare]